MKYIPISIVTMLWGLSFVATKIVVKDISPLTAAFFRFLIALLTLYFLPRKRNISLFNKHKILAGFWGITAYFASENFALKLTSPTNAAMIVSTAPIWYVLFTQLFHRKKTRVIQYFSSILALIGVALVILNGKIYLEVNSLGDFLAFGAAFSWVFYTHHVTKLKDRSSLTAIFEITFWGVITLIPFSIIEIVFFKPNLNFNFSSVFGLLYLGLFCSALGYFLWNKSIEILGDRSTTNAVYLIPIVTAVSEALIFKQIPTLLLISGIILVVLGLYVFEKFEERGEING
jgi:drug/metabolite transporter (DMT)-like permease